jgi:thioredoxin reductase (NADPH)
MSSSTSEQANATSLVRVFGRPMDPAAYLLRDFLSRTVAKYTWTELTNDYECIEALGVPLDRLRLPVVQLPGGEQLEAPDPAALAKRLGWVVQPSTDVYDLSIYGAGPAGLSAAVYGASEGLHVALIERDAVGGQRATAALSRTTSDSRPESPEPNSPSEPGSKQSASAPSYFRCAPDSRVGSRTACFG